MAKTIVEQELDVIFGEFRDHTVVYEFVRAVRESGLKGTLYIGYPVLSIDDGKIEFDALLVSSEIGVAVFDLYSFSGIKSDDQDVSEIPEDVSTKQEALYAALINKLNSFKELRRGRKLVVEIVTATIHPLGDINVESNGSRLISRTLLHSLPLMEEPLDEPTLQHLNAAIQRISNLKPQKKRENVTRNNSKGGIIKEIEAQIANLDLWQKRGSIEYVNGPQRVRGLAGSGKTVVLALKAAYLHVKRPDWDICVTFNSRSLYQQFESLLQRFVFAQIGDEPDWEKLHVMHAWGNWEKPGVYSKAVSLIGCQFRDFSTASRMYGYNMAFDGSCREALSALNGRSIDMFDMVLIDEAQDLPTSFFRLVYLMTKAPKRIVWAYDDLQNLGDYLLPSEVELFGKDAKGAALVRLENKIDEPQQDIVLPRCYRNPPWTLVTAHGVGFGTRRSPIVQMFPDPSIWLRLGYRRVGGTLDYDTDVVVERDPKSIPDFFDRLLDRADSLQTHLFDTKKDQYDWVASAIKTLIEHEELQHTDFMIILPDVMTSKSAGALALKSLQAAGLQGHIAGVTSSKDEMFRPGSIAITHIYRAKGNEAAVVFVVDADFGEGGDIKKRRNVLFTAITRSRAWTYICGVGQGMIQISAEIDAIRQGQFRLAFHYPQKAMMDKMSVSAPSSDGGRALPSDLDADDLRLLIKKVRERGGIDQLPPDVQLDIMDILGQSPDEAP